MHDGVQRFVTDSDHHVKDATNETRLWVESGAAMNAATVNSADPNWRPERQLADGYSTNHVSLPRLLYEQF